MDGEGGGRAREAVGRVMPAGGGKVRERIGGMQGCL
jgi:hypothetical protein